VPDKGATYQQLKADLDDLGIKTANDRMAFFRGAIYAGLVDARRARQPKWRSLVKAIQPAIGKHIGGGKISLGLRDILEIGHGK
jgi:hypothetical protein